MKSIFHRSIALGALAGAMAMTPSTAFAQDAEEEQAAEEGESDYVIVVTAQGRSQSLADVPIAVSAISGDLLEKSGVADIRDLNQVAPSLLVSSTGNEARWLSSRVMAVRKWRCACSRSPAARATSPSA